MAQRNNTWSLHVHVGVRGADRAIAVCDHLREVLPLLLARLRQLAVPRRSRHRPAHGAHRDLHPHVPALRGPEPFGDWARYAEFIELLERTGPSSSRPSCGGASGPTTPSAPSRCGSATRRPRRGGVRRSPALITACIAQSALDYDGGRAGRAARQREIEENLWRAIRHGLERAADRFRRGAR